MIVEKAHAKLNLALRILGKRNDGYHNIDTIFQSLELSDIIRVEAADTIEVTCTDPTLACDETNLAYKAAMALQPFCRKGQGARIHIEKKIPIAAGLGGGSADCATTLRCLNRLWGLKLPYEDLCRIGATIGADVPFCLRGGTARGRGRGDIITQLPDFPSMMVMLIHPHIVVHTEQAYAKFDANPVDLPIRLDLMEKAVWHGSLDELSTLMGNTFESLVISDYPEIERCKDILEMYDLKPMLSGSGPTVFAIVPPPGDIGMLGIVGGVLDDTDVFVSRFSRGEGYGDEY